MKNFAKTIALDTAMLIGAAIMLVCGGIGAFAEECEELSGEVFRLHIPANSDSEEDQAVKYRLRDYIIEEYGDIFAESVSADQAAENAEKLLPEIERNATDFLRNSGFSYGARAEVVEMYFTTRVYENITMPAGNYKALRIILGTGSGKNWWCVLFPPLCLPACGERELFTEEQSKLIESGETVEVRFALYEWLCGLFGV